MLSEASPSVSAPIVLFTYFNPIMARGLEKFCADVRAAGGSGLLVPDIPLEETGTIRDALNAEGLELVLLTTPTTGACPPPVAARLFAFPTFDTPTPRTMVWPDGYGSVRAPSGGYHK